MAEMSIIASMATRHILAEVARSFEHSSGTRVSLLAIGGVDAARRVRAGEACDLVVLAEDALASLVREGLVAADSTRVFARSATAVAVRSKGPLIRPSATCSARGQDAAAPPQLSSPLGERIPDTGGRGAAWPTVCDEAGLKALIAGARAVGVSTGPSGVAVRGLLQDWGYDLMRSGWLVEAPPGVPVAHLLTRGEVDVGFQQLSELLGETGIDIVGTVPATLLARTAFGVGLSARASQAELARAFIDALSTPAAAAIIRRQGMESAD